MSSVDIFGRQLSNKNYITEGKSNGRGEIRRGPPGEGFKFTKDGHYDIEEKRLCNIADAYDSNDAVSKKIALSMIENETKHLVSITKILKDSDKHNTEVISQLTIKLNTLEKSAEKSRLEFEELSTRVNSIFLYLKEKFGIQ